MTVDFKMMHPAEQICLIMKRIYDCEMTTLTGGNLSVMDDEGVMWVSPTNVDKGSLKTDDIVQVLPDGSIKGKYAPTSEYRAHHKILTGSPGMRAVVHAHSPAMVTMSALHKLPNSKLSFAAWEAVEDIGLAEYGMPGTLKLVECVGEVFSKGYKAALLKNHAAFLGSAVDLPDAFRRFEEMDYAARLQINAAVWGPSRSLNGSDIAKIAALSAKAMPEYEREKTTPAELAARKKLAELTRRANQKRLFTGSFGHISTRVSGNDFLIVKAGVDSAYAAAGDFVLIRDGKRERGMVPERLTVVHQKIYEKHPDINALVLAAPTYAMTFAVTDQPYDVTIIPESYGVLRSCLKFPIGALADSKELTDQLTLDSPFALIENYGALFAGVNATLAFDKLEVCEFSAQSIHFAKRLDEKIISMTQDMIDEMDNQ